ncbi:MAG: CDP-diacylglycerol--glycerol-3-phosphate 3-phosphatidyltransferase [Clostridia bacterium]|nr:CDP-diacylglycerol--glycerol-3-phosphate 3-phosphatidyltransferase [Clostridia bacterium]
MKLNLPNKITLSRILLVPIFMLFILPIPAWVVNSDILSFMREQLTAINEFIQKTGNYVAAFIFIIAASTDGVDGYIARKRKQVTNIGKFLDPIADKLLVTAALIALVQRGDAAGWAGMVIIGREFIVTGLRLVAAGEGIVIAASNWGKIKTITQMVAIIASLFKFDAFHFDRYAMLVAVIVTVYSGYDYIKKNVHVMGQEKS